MAPWGIFDLRRSKWDRYRRVSENPEGEGSGCEFSKRARGPGKQQNSPLEMDYRGRDLLICYLGFLENSKKISVYSRVFVPTIGA